MKRLLVLVSVLACAPHVAPAVSLVRDLPPQEERHDVGVTLLGGCRIVGRGEPPREGARFPVYESNDANDAAFVIAHPERAHVVWSNFPERADDGRTRARVGLGGQGVRYDGYASLYGRTFTTTRRMESVTGHLWARAGASIYLMAAGEGGVVFASATTPFVSPKTIVVQGNCADVRYEPDVPPAKPRASSPSVVNRNASFQLFASPSEGRPFTTVTIGERGLSLDVVERRADFLRVATDEENIGFDAWVPASQLVSDTVHPRTSNFYPEESDASIAPLSRIGRVARDTPLWAGYEPTLVRGAVVEANAIVRFDPSEEIIEDGRALVPFELADGFIVAREGGHLWIAKDVLLSAR